MSILRVEFFASVSGEALPSTPLSAVSLPVTSTPTVVGDQPVVPSNPVSPFKLLVRLHADRPAYVTIANVPKLTDTSSYFLIVPNQALQLAAFAGQRVAVVEADDYAIYSQTDVDALVAAAVATALANASSSSGSSASSASSLSLDLSQSAFL